MSDQDFFFDEEEEAAKPAPKTSNKPVSKPAAKQGARPAAKGAPAKAAPAGGFMEQSVTMMVASLMSVIALLIGVIIGFVVAPDSIATELPGGGTTNSTVTAPSLTEEQLQSGQMPEGHPTIDGSVVPTEAPVGE